ncbi:hypothetical protein FD755_013907 [Muntiacus reevesi]|uniref:AMOP domain-containing protein n=1 Tax=Muntiacus reevesi TaxID=9886 RepID=A0A5N3XMY2_MUNRE|nr:hypothetical protein FD755_013907 [Muntiacus reevesi]
MGSGPRLPGSNPGSSTKCLCHPRQIPALPEKRRRPLLLSRAHLQAGPCQHKHRALPESAPLVLDKMPSPGTLEGTPLLLELQKLPGLANTDLSALNPNIHLRATGEMEVQGCWWEDPSQGQSPGVGGEEQEEEEDRPPEDSEGEDQEEDSEEHDGDDQEPGFRGAAGGWEQGPLSPGDWAFEEPDRCDYQLREEWSPWSPCSGSRGGRSQGRTLLVSSLPHDTEDKDPLGLPSEGRQPLAHDAMDMLSPSHQVLWALPSCPCAYPPEAVSSAVSLRDKHQGRSFRRRDASGLTSAWTWTGPQPTSACALCSTPAAQHCCYHAGSRLLIRGKGAGAPDLVSTDVSPELHFKVDTLLWIPCKADCSRYHAVWTPNNGRACADNPPEEEYLAQLQEAKQY